MTVDTLLIFECVASTFTYFQQCLTISTAWDAIFLSWGTLFHKRSCIRISLLYGTLSCYLIISSSIRYNLSTASSWAQSNNVSFFSRLNILGCLNIFTDIDNFPPNNDIFIDLRWCYLLFLVYILLANEYFLKIGNTLICLLGLLHVSFYWFLSILVESCGNCTEGGVFIFKWWTNRLSPIYYHAPHLIINSFKKFNFINL